MKSPLFLIDGYAVEVFWTVCDLESHLEPPEVHTQTDYLICDAEGRRVWFDVVVDRECFGLWTTERVEFREAEDLPKHKEELHAALLGILTKIDSANAEASRSASLDQLVEMCIQRLDQECIHGEPDK